ncbi:MAG TPA: TMEM165/GDT1 family protein [Caulobacterales bacterium]|nr:TMEM165/GDT1 family protein [Caulobacterales bacterium]
METLLTSIGIVALAEIGDKTQLLAILLAARFRQPLPIIAGIFAATILNHALAAAAGFYVAQFLSGQGFRIAVGVAFIAMAAWTLVPDKADDLKQRSGGGVFITTLVSFFFVEIGDKTQIATSLLAARFHDILLVATGATIGMMLANVPAVLFGEAVTKIAPLRYIRIAAAIVFAALGVWVLIEALRA